MCLLCVDYYYLMYCCCYCDLLALAIAMHAFDLVVVGSSTLLRLLKLVLDKGARHSPK